MDYHNDRAGSRGLTEDMKAGFGKRFVAMYVALLYEHRPSPSGYALGFKGFYVVDLVG